MYLPLKDISNQARNHKDTDYDHVKKTWLLLFGSLSSKTRVHRVRILELLRPSMSFRAWVSGDFLVSLLRTERPVGSPFSPSKVGGLPRTEKPTDRVMSLPFCTKPNCESPELLPSTKKTSGNLGGVRVNGCAECGNGLHRLLRRPSS